MKIAAVPETIVERLIALAGLAPTPIIDTFHAVIVARSVMVATRLGVFEAVAAGAATAAEIAQRLDADARATEKLLNVLVAIGYLRCRAGRYTVTRLARRWLLRDSPHSIHDNMLLRFMEWEAIETVEDFVRSGEPLDVHDRIRDDQWETYQRGMRCLARLSAGEVARRVKLPPEPRTMLDVGGGHGAFAVAFCRRHGRLAATVLDLPAAVEKAAPILAEEEMGARVVHRAGDALTEDLGEDDWDLIFMSHLVHHFDAEANAALLSRAARALRPGGVVAILDVLRPASPDASNQTGALLDLYFAVTSNSGTWSGEEISGWQSDAGLRPGKSVPLRTAPGITVLTASKS
ncbi:MAG: methyltransferase [Methyloligellaceae bacterium]